MYIRCPSQRDAEDWVRCFAQIYELAEEEKKNETETFAINARGSVLDIRKTNIFFAVEETPKWAEDVSKILKSSETWELAGENCWKSEKFLKKIFVINASSDTCLEALLDRRGEWDFLMKNYRRISSHQNSRIYHAQYNNIDIIVLAQVYIDSSFQMIISFETVPHIYYPSSIEFKEFYYITQHSFQQNICMLTCITNTKIFDKSYSAMKGYVEILNFKTGNAEINIPSRNESFIGKDERDYSKPLDFDTYFIYGEGGDYERDPINGGIILLDKDLISKQRGILSSMIKKIGKNLLTGKSIMNISIPVNVFGKQTLLQQLSKTFGYSPIFLEKAAAESGLERFKYVVTFAVSLLHLPVSQRQSFNPIIGETLQGFLGKAQVFSEQVSHHPPISSFQILGESFEMHGYYEFMASTSANSVKARQKGLTVINIENNCYYITLPLVNITGTLIGKRYFNWQGILTVTSPSENLYCEIVFNPDKKGAISGLFSKSQTPSDFFVGIIQRVKPSHPILTEQCRKDMQESGKKSLAGLAEEVEADLCKIEGYWTLFLDIDNHRFWSFDEYRPYLLAPAPDLLPSDSNFRGDLKCMIEGNIEEAQVQKDILENIQRRDNKLRHDYKH